MGTAQRFEPLIRPFANLFKIKPGERIGNFEVRGIRPMWPGTRTHAPSVGSA